MKCKHCLFTCNDKGKLQRHMEHCPFNPEKKNCCTCENIKCDGIYEVDCTAGREDCRRIFEGNLPCPSWKGQK